MRQLTIKEITGVFGGGCACSLADGDLLPVNSNADERACYAECCGYYASNTPQTITMIYNGVSTECLTNSMANRSVVRPVAQVGGVEAPATNWWDY